MRRLLYLIYTIPISEASFNRCFVFPKQISSILNASGSSSSKREPKAVRNILVTLLAHGCFIGPHTMARLTGGISYEEIHHITDWQLTEDAQRLVLAIIVNAISKLDVTKNWGSGETSSRDGQRFEYKRKSLRQTFSTKFGDYALEFYTLLMASGAKLARENLMSKRIRAVA